MNQTTIKKTIAILFGGHSTEYKVSLQSAAAVIRSIDTSAYVPVLIGITASGQWLRYYGDTDAIEKDTWQSGHCTPAILSPDTSHHGLLEINGTTAHLTHIDLAFPMLHGKNGEDGTIQGLLALAGIPCVGCGLLSSALCMDKAVAHRLAAAAGIPVPKSVTLHTYEQSLNKAMAEKIDALGYPVFVKPANAGSSFGITRVTAPQQLPAAIAQAFSHDTKVVIEEAIRGFEVGCAILGRDTLTIGEIDEIELSDGFFDYTEKYTLKTSKIHMPARISEKDSQRIKAAALRLYRILECSGFARIDLFFTPDGEIIFNEINTIPGFTAHSRYPGMMKGIGMDFKTIIRKLLEVSL